MLDIVKEKTEDIVSLLEHVGYFLINEQQKHEYSVYKKQDGSILTDLDIASETLIKNELNSIFGDIQILSEENNENENIQIVNNKKHFFLLDPIDGTNSFNNGGEFTINLAFCIDRKPVFSFIHNPIKKTILFGDINQSFKKNNGKIQKLPKVKGVDKYDTIVYKKQNQTKIIIGKNNFSDNYYVNNLIKEMQNCGYFFSKYCLKSSSAMGKLLCFVNGECDAFLTANCCKNWDVLPAIPILHSVGGFNNMKSFKVYENKNFNSGTFIVANNENLLDDLINISLKMSNSIICK